MLILDQINAIIHIFALFIFLAGIYLLIKQRQQLDLLRVLINTRKEQKIIVSDARQFMKNLCQILRITYHENTEKKQLNYKKINTTGLLEIFSHLSIESIKEAEEQSFLFVIRGEFSENKKQEAKYLSQKLGTKVTIVSYPKEGL